MKGRRVIQTKKFHSRWFLVPFGDLGAQFGCSMNELLKSSGVGGMIVLRMDYIGRNQFLDRLTRASESVGLQRCLLEAAENNTVVWKN